MMPNQFVQERSKVKSILQQEEGMTADPEGPDPTDTRDDLQRLDKGKSRDGRHNLRYQQVFGGCLKLGSVIRR